MSFLGTREDLGGQDTILHALHPDDRILVQAYWQMALQGDPGCEKPIEYRIQSKKGNWEWIQSRVTTLRPSIKGKATQLLVNLTVITGRKEMQQQLEEYVLSYSLKSNKTAKEYRTTCSHRAISVLLSLSHLPRHSGRPRLTQPTTINHRRSLSSKK